MQLRAPKNVVKVTQVFLQCYKGHFKLYICIYFIFSASTDFNTTNRELEFGPQSSEQQQCVNITIISDDALLEFDEVFSVVLTSSANNVRISRNLSTITILDDDSTSALDYTSFTSSCIR